MKLRLVILMTLAFLGCTLLPTHVCGAEKLNVLFIAVDDLRPELGCYGNNIVKTPNIDKLAAGGVRFDRAYCQYPLCNPSRTSMLTGRQPTTTKVLDNLKYFRKEFPDIVTLPQLFRAAGYVTARSGKIFHGSIDDEPSWMEGGEAVRPPMQPLTPQEQARRVQQSDRYVAVPGDGENQPDYKTATKGIELLEKYKDRPFFIAVGFVKPHSPLIAPQKYFDLYDPAKIPLPVDFAGKPTVGPGIPSEAVPARNGDLFVNREASREEAQKMIQAYCACASWTDAQVGRVLDKLDELKLRDRTLIVFFGDHGYHLGEKGKWSKHGSLYEAGARVPLIIDLPGAAANKTCARPVQLLDVYPTLARACGLAVPAGTEGHSLLPLLENPQAAWDHPAYTVTQRGKLLGRSVRTDRFRYTEWDDEGTKAELYDHSTDPHEQKNLAADPGHAAKVKELRELLRAGLQGSGARK